MKLENGHHVRAEDLTYKQYKQFCQKAKAQGFDDSECEYYMWFDFDYIGILYDSIYFDVAGQIFEDKPEKLLTIEQSLSEE